MKPTDPLKRPVWVTVLGIIYILGGISVGIVIIFVAGISRLSNFEEMLTTLITILVPSLFFIASYGLFKLKKWTSKPILTIAIFFLIIGLSWIFLLSTISPLITNIIFFFRYLGIPMFILFLVWWAVHKSKELFVN